MGDPTRFKVLVWHRRARKTSTALEKVALEAHNPHVKNKVYWIVFPTYAEAKEAVWKDPDMLFRVIPHSLIERQNEVELTLYLHSGSIVALKGGDDPDSLRGAGPYACVFDEYGYMKPEVWDIVEPIMRASGGWAWFLGTPNGKNHFYEMFNYARRSGDKEWKAWELKASESGVFRDDQLEIVKKRVTARKGEAFYLQEYECDWIESSSAVFRKVSEIMTAKPKKPETGHVYVMGVDLAKHTDYTVIVAYDRATNAQVYQDRFKDLEWPFIKKKISTISEHYNNALVMLDATGVGDPIYDDLARAGIPVEPIKITQPLKKELVEKLSIWVDQRQFRMIRMEETKFEFEDFRYEIGPTGLVRYGAPEGHNDDIVIAHALAVWSLSPLYKRKAVKKKTRLQKYYEKARRQAYEGEEWYDQDFTEEWSAL